MSKRYVELVDELALHMIKVQLSESVDLAAGAVSARNAFMQPE